jgi:hypothetical protein
LAQRFQQDQPADSRRGGERVFSAIATIVTRAVTNVKEVAVLGYDCVGQSAKIAGSGEPSAKSDSHELMDANSRGAGKG